MSNDRDRTGDEANETSEGQRTGWKEFARSRRRFLAGAAGAGGLGLLAGTGGAGGGGTESAGEDGNEGNENDGDEEDDNGDGREEGEVEAYDVTSSDGLRLRIWKESQGDPSEAVLFVHGATYGGVSMFDPPVADEWDGWMDYAANAGQAAYAVDIRGYGDSERPPEFENEPEESDPVVPAAVAARDVRDATEWIQDEQGFDRVHLVGLSSGTWRVRALFSGYDPDVATVTLAAGSYEQFEAPDEDLPAWTTQEKSEFVDRWRAQVPESEEPDAWIGGEEHSADEVINAVWKAIYRSGQGLDGDDESGEETILNPTNLLQDAKHDPADVTAPTLVIRGSSDPLISREGALRLYDAVGADDHRKQYPRSPGGRISSSSKRGGWHSTTPSTGSRRDRRDGTRSGRHRRGADRVPSRRFSRRSGRCRPPDPRARSRSSHRGATRRRRYRRHGRGRRSRSGSSSEARG